MEQVPMMKTENAEESSSMVITQRIIRPKMKMYKQARQSLQFDTDRKKCWKNEVTLKECLIKRRQCQNLKFNMSFFKNDDGERVKNLTMALKSLRGLQKVEIRLKGYHYFALILLKISNLSSSISNHVSYSI